MFFVAVDPFIPSPLVVVVESCTNETDRRCSGSCCGLSVPALVLLAATTRKGCIRSSCRRCGLGALRHDCSGSGGMSCLAVVRPCGVASSRTDRGKASPWTAAAAALAGLVVSVAICFSFVRSLFNAFSRIVRNPLDTSTSRRPGRIQSNRCRTGFIHTSICTVIVNIFPADLDATPSSVCAKRSVDAVVVIVRWAKNRCIHSGKRLWDAGTATASGWCWASQCRCRRSRSHRSSGRTSICHATTTPIPVAAAATHATSDALPDILYSLVLPPLPLRSINPKSNENRIFSLEISRECGLDVGCATTIDCWCTLILLLKYEYSTRDSASWRRKHVAPQQQQTVPMRNAQCAKTLLVYVCVCVRRQSALLVSYARTHAHTRSISLLD